VLSPDEFFGQDVCGLLVSQDVLKSNLFSLDFLPQKMMSHFNVFGAIMQLGVARNSDRGLIINMEDSSWVNIEA
jgi:hypothetical protein